jgi:hypothetical protein
MKRFKRLLPLMVAGLASFAVLATTMQNYICVNTGNSNGWDTCSLRGYSSCLDTVNCNIYWDIPQNSEICSPLPGWACDCLGSIIATAQSGFCEWVSRRCQCHTSGQPKALAVPTC